MPATTLEAAHAHLTQLLTNRQGTLNHTVSIVQLNNDRILYFKNTNRSFVDLTNLHFSLSRTWQRVVHSIQYAISQLTPSFTNRRG